jgi:hypothetical protein
MKFMPILLAISLLLTFLMPALAADASADEEMPNQELIVRLAGDVSADGTLLTLSMEPGAVATHAIRVYSEPSHTLLVVAVDQGFVDGLEAWQESWVEVDRPLASITTDLPDGRARVHVTGRPTADDRIAVYVYGTWPDGSIGETLVSDAKVGAGSFAFSTSLVTQGEGPTEYEHCCESANCSKMCKTCADKAFECCLLRDCCWIECGWGTASCTTAECG